jgi:hypothetical protein
MSNVENGDRFAYLDKRFCPHERPVAAMCPSRDSDEREIPRHRVRRRSARRASSGGGMRRA